ncbi:ABC transporter ATP-binding protein [Haloarcula nitratireducens]|uniref:ABC transporter ATP-binding protein n=1 Tax=Haloarcula nitratireducens TaxID=2487749 RepID=A0AAW4PG89_9EURY|nr:ABC transporter ATP-binding protein [Halomicroarcula nitratireducens]MBX0297441.1 ABC transporter ATP-binding protein [Halomicroarcula nitratireducens]
MEQLGQPTETVTRDTPVVEGESVIREYTRGGGGFFSRTAAPTVRALNGVSATIHPGEVVGIAGPSGSGKSTLLHLLAGLDVPTSGTITLAGQNITSLSARERAALRLEHVGIIFQRFHLLDALSARANVALPLVELGYGKRTRRERAAELLTAVGLDERQTHKPGQLSGGEQQRVAIARALTTNPSLVIADEPTGELDTSTGERVLDLLVDIADEQAVVLASHDQQALDVCDRIIRLRDGEIDRSQ